MKMNGAQIIVETLIEMGCECVFGYPGGAVLSIYDELYKADGRIRHIITAHEQGAAHAADGYARVSGKVGVVFATSGPGATNLVTGIATAHLDSVPLVAITGNVALPLLGRDSFQEVDTMGITMPITKHNYIVKDVKDLAPTIREAFAVATSGRPGPVLIDIPKDIQTGIADYAPAAPIKKKSLPTPPDKEIDRVVEYIKEAKRPFIYSGGGVVISGAGKEVAALAERAGAYVGFSMMGLAALPGNHPLCLGMTGMHGRFAATKANSEADLIVAVGVRFSDRATGNKARYSQNAKIIHIDIDYAEIDKNIPVCLGLTGDIKETLSRILSKLEPQTRPEWASEIGDMIKEEISNYPMGKPLHPKNILEKIKERAGEDTIVATDVGQHQMWTAQYYRFERPRTFLTSGGLGTMGFGMGAAIGGYVARGEGRALLITGDGSFGMNLNELSTAVTNRIPLVIFIMNNGTLGMVRQWQTLFFDKRYSSTTLGRRTDFVKLAEAFGAIGIRVSNAGELDRALDAAFSADGPVVVDCIIDIDEYVLPMIPPGGSIENIIVK